MIVALWRCLVCSATRAYGSHPPESDYQPWLHCRCCKRPTRHTFAGIN